MGFRTRIPSRLPRQGDTIGIRSQDDQGESIRRIAKNVLLNSVIIPDVVFATGLRVAGTNNSQTNADVLTGSTLGETGAVVPSVSSSSKRKRVDFGRPIGTEDRVALKASEASSGPWWDGMEAFPRVVSGANVYGMWWEPVAGNSSAVDVYFGASGAYFGVTWATVAAAGWRWKVALERAVAGGSGATADDVQIEHTLSRAVQGFVVVEASGPGVIFQSPVENNFPDRLIYLRSSAPLTASILFF